MKEKWTAVYEDSDELILIETERSHSYIAEISIGEDSDGKPEFDRANRILCAVNSHADLLAAGHKLLAWAKYMGGFDSREWKRLEAVLRRAGKGEV